MLLILFAVGVPLAVPAAAGETVPARVRLANVFSDQAVLQRGVRLPIYGQAAAGETVTVRLAGQTAEAVADAGGRWRVTLEPLAAGGPHELVAEAPSGTATSKDVLVGDVWLCSGQSNMEWPVRSSDNADEEIANADFPKIRLLTVPNRPAASPADTQEGVWRVCSPKTVASFSAVGYFMGRELHREAGVPIGLIDASWGGTIVEAWMNDSALADAGLEQRLEAARESLAKVDLVTPEGPSLTVAADTSRWPAVDYNDAAWHPVDLPGIIEASGPQIDGVFWYRRTFDAPEAEAGVLTLGPIDDFDETYVNGQLVGQTGRETPGFYQHPREYVVPAGLLRATGNVIAVRVTDIGGEGGFKGEASELNLRVGERDFPLAGRWRAAWERVVVDDPDAEVPPEQPQNLPTALYNGMIHPLGPLATRGVAWYQGESNANDEAAEYGRRLTAMVQAWRERFPPDAEGQPPAFLIVQLANLGPQNPAAAYTDNWAVLREQQRLVADALDRSAVAVAVDVGDPDDVHPTDKQSVGHRLALLALREVYGRDDLVVEGPRVKAIERDGVAVTLTFANASDLSFTGDAGKAFAVADDSGTWAWAVPSIEGDTVRLVAPGIEKPSRVRLSWGIHPNATLHNATGLPAPPFELAVE